MVPDGPKSRSQILHKSITATTIFILSLKDTWKHKEFVVSQYSPRLIIATGLTDNKVQIGTNGRARGRVRCVHYDSGDGIRLYECALYYHAGNETSDSPRDCKVSHKGMPQASLVEFATVDAAQSLHFKTVLLSLYKGAMTNVRDIRAAITNELVDTELWFMNVFTSRVTSRQRRSRQYLPPSELFDHIAHPPSAGLTFLSTSTAISAPAIPMLFTRTNIQTIKQQFETNTPCPQRSHLATRSPAYPLTSHELPSAHH
ncbi:hypothetical protein J6590_065016 [Homalodisca vitripennis]|nr:hypothetical protein J6590_065016 [Homalodisca vitripennis]